MATLVTGGTGFVGVNIVKALAERGHEVVSLDVVAPDVLVKRYVEPWAERVSFIQGDILNKGDLELAASQHNIDKIVHAAVFTGITHDVETQLSRSIVDINWEGTANVLDLACGLSLERFMYVSSGSVYGPREPDEMLPEDTVLNPRTLYAVTKYASEMLTRRYGELHGFQTVSLRLSSPYGPMERVTGHRVVMSVLYEWTGNIVRGEPIVVGERNAGRSYTYVADSAAAICAVLDASTLPHDVYNISVGEWITLDQMIVALQGLRPSIQVVDDPTREHTIFASGGPRGPMDGTRLREDLGFAPGFDIAAGLKDYLRWREEYSFLD